MLKAEPQAQSEVPRPLDQLFIKYKSALSDPAVSALQPDSPVAMLDCRDGIGPMLCSAWFPPSMMLKVKAEMFNLSFLSDPIIWFLPV